MGGQQMVTNPEFVVVPGKGCYKPVELEYEKSWDWLMPVVEKIHNLPFTGMNSDTWADVITLPIYSTIEEVYESVIVFIKWYNENNKS